MVIENERIPETYHFVSNELDRSDFEDNEISKIKNYQYAVSQSMRTIKIPDYIVTIGERAFFACRRLTSITLPENLKVIGDRCFSDCISLEFIKIPNMVEQIGNGAFDNCRNLKYVELPKKLEKITFELFHRCQGLRYIEIPENVKEIQWGAFRGCKNLIGISIPQVITYIPAFCFKRCRSLQYFKYSVWDKINEDYINIGPYAFERCMRLVEVDLSDSSVYSIGRGCFKNCSRLRRIILSKKTRLINTEAFMDCYHLQYVGYKNTGFHEIDHQRLFGIDLPYVTEIDDKAFGDCREIEYIKLYETQRLRNDVFYRINLKYISLPGDIHLPNAHMIFDQNNKVEKVMIHSNIFAITYNIAFGILWWLVWHNPKLANQPCTIDELYPLEVLVGVLGFNNHPYRQYIHKGDPLSEEYALINMVFYVLINAPGTLEFLLHRNLFENINTFIITL